ncbi:MAG: LysM peptidoglycan-binding domain-containing protein [Niabella sp.]
MTFGYTNFEKVQIYAYNNIDYADNHLVGEPYKAMINPESYVLDYKVEFNDQQAPGTTGRDSPPVVKRPDEMQFEFLFDCSNIIQPTIKKDVYDELQDFKKLLLEYNSESHDFKHFKLVWGKFIFKGRCTSLNITYKLFNPDGTPIRAVCKVGFKGGVEEELRVAIEAPASPDLTHVRIVKEGDTLPALCYEVYGDSKYYLEVVRANNLQNFRKLETGSRLSFPPVK